MANPFLWHICTKFVVENEYRTKRWKSNDKNMKRRIKNKIKMSEHQTNTRIKFSLYLVDVIVYIFISLFVCNEQTEYYLWSLRVYFWALPHSLTISIGFLLRCVFWSLMLFEMSVFSQFFFPHFIYKNMQHQNVQYVIKTDGSN